VRHVDVPDVSQAEQLLRGLASCDENMLQSILAVAPASSWPVPASPTHVLPRLTSALIHVAALLATGGSTTSLRWAVELAVQAGAGNDEIVEVLASVASIVGAARVVAAAPRLALAIGYDVEVEGWDGY
jgi:4-carboxymuconolactone decarboxylase